MPNLPISGLPAAGALDGTEAVPVEKAGTTVQTTTQAIADLGGGGGGNTVIARASFGATGTIEIAGSGVDSVIWDCGTPGTYQVVFTTDFFGSVPIVVATAHATDPQRFASVDPDGSINSFVILIKDVDGNPIDGGFNLHAVGPAGPPI